MEWRKSNRKRGSSPDTSSQVQVSSEEKTTTLNLLPVLSSQTECNGVLNKQEKKEESKDWVKREEIGSSKELHSKEEKRTRRGKKDKKSITRKLTVIGTNADGLSSKKGSLVQLQVKIIHKFLWYKKRK